ncbi:hypothetical protein K435DRAFT_783640, partial [Dendrothele bispora CBS 962.96]
MSHSHSDSTFLEHPIPFLMGLALTPDQLELLANHYVGVDYVKEACQGDSAYALERSWKEHGIDNLIPKITAPCGSTRYLYILGVLPSFDGKPPKANVDPRFVKKIWRELGEPPIWKEVDVVSTPWPYRPGLPEPHWLYPKMYEAIQKMKGFS